MPSDRNSGKEVVIRKATKADISFLVKAIVAAEKSGTYTVNYQKIFNLSDRELFSFLSKILKSEEPNHEFTYTSYYVAELQGRVVAAMSAFIEELDGISSIAIKSAIIPKMIGIENWKKAVPAFRLLGSLYMDRAPGSLQIEYAHTRPNVQAIGLMEKLARTVMRTEKELHPELKFVEVHAIYENSGTARVCRDIGYVTHLVVESENDEVLKYVPSKKRILRRYFYDERVL